jgi:hypothetical protein
MFLIPSKNIKKVQSEGKKGALPKGVIHPKGVQLKGKAAFCMNLSNRFLMIVNDNEKYSI